MEVTREQLAQGIGAAFATTFWQVIKDDLPKKFTWDSFYESNKEEVKEKLHLYYTNVPEGEELVKLQNLADEAFKEACQKIREGNE